MATTYANVVHLVIGITSYFRNHSEHAAFQKLIFYKGG